MLHMHWIDARRRLLVAAVLAACLVVVLPGISEAHAILLRSDPAKDAVLPVAPSQVRMWFSEALNPAFSTAVVVNGANKRVDIGNALVSPSDPTEMDVTLKPNLPPAVYVVIYRTDSNVDGHILTGSFLFAGGLPTGRYHARLVASGVKDAAQNPMIEKKSSIFAERPRFMVDP